MPEVSRISVLSSGRCQGSKISMPFGGQMPAGEFDARYSMLSPVNRARVEKGPEPRDEEHHLRGDEQHHPVAEADLDDARVVAGLAPRG